jgi:hypothetical protein
MRRICCCILTEMSKRSIFTVFYSKSEKKLPHCFRVAQEWIFFVPITGWTWWEITAETLTWPTPTTAKENFCLVSNAVSFNRKHFYSPRLSIRPSPCFHLEKITATFCKSLQGFARIGEKSSKPVKIGFLVRQSSNWIRRKRSAVQRLSRTQRPWQPTRIWPGLNFRKASLFFQSIV